MCECICVREENGHCMRQIKVKCVHIKCSPTVTHMWTSHVSSKKASSESYVKRALWLVALLRKETRSFMCQVKRRLPLQFSNRCVLNSKDGCFACECICVWQSDGYWMQQIEVCTHEICRTHTHTHTLRKYSHTVTHAWTSHVSRVKI